MSERRGTKALELWCRRITEGYPGVNVQNMTTSWKDGLAFCAMIHHFRPDLIDFDSLDKNNVHGNNELAFRIAEQHLGIPALLDAEDMASCSTPDRLSILTYLSQFYQMLGGSSPSRLAMSRTTESPEEKITPIPGSPKEKAALGLGVRRDLCTVCGLPVFLAEKLVLGSAAYHRTCFRCARCSNQLTLGNYYETEEGQYCCETCPDEELTSATTQNYARVAMSDKNETNEMFEDLCCNEENTNPPTTGDHSATRMGFDDASIPDIIVQTSRLRLNFISNHLLSNQDTADGTDFKCSANLPDQQESISRNSTSGQLEFQSKRNEDSLNREGSGNDFVIERLQSQPTRNEKLFDSEHSNESIDRNFAKTDSAHEELMNSEEELTTASHNDIIRNKSVDSATKINAAEELLNDETVKPVDNANCLSLVQARLRLFENTKDLTEKGRSQNIDVLRLKAQSKKHNLIEKDSKEPTINSDVIGIEESTSKFKVSEDITENHVNDASDDTSFSKLASLRISETTDSPDDTLEDSTKNSPTKKTENDTMIHSQEKSKNKGNNENQSIVSVASETNSMNSTSAATKIDYPEDLNPFNSDEEEDSNAHSIITNPSQTNTNPFKDEETMEEEFEKMEQFVIPTPAARNNVDNNTTKSQSHEEVSTKRRLIAPQINLNPFWSDDDDQESDLECKTKILEAKPVPKPRTRNIQELETNAPKSNQNYSNLNTSNSSVTSLESATSFGATCRKKKPAPLPPNRKEQCSPDQHAPLTSPSNIISKTRKIKPAPPPPMQTSSPYNISINTSLNCEASPISKSGDENKSNKVWEDEKISKDVANRNRQSFTHVPCKEGLYDRSFVDKSTEGKWKRKKGPAPPCPMPLKRKIKVMSLKDVKLELDEIELQQQGLEKQGVRLEQLIRSKCESESKPDDVSLGTAVEELVLELFALVNEKNELFRRQAELMLLRRQQRLEEEHAEVEYQIRCLMSQQESMKTDFDKQREEALIKRLVEIVERRNEIVDCLEMDRRREIEEDRSIHKHMDLFAVKNKNQTSDKDSTQRKSKQKENKLKDKTKEKKLKKILKKDIDKDIDEIELKLKRHNKRKWF